MTKHHAVFLSIACLLSGCQPPPNIGGGQKHCGDVTPTPPSLPPVPAPVPIVPRFTILWKDGEYDEQTKRSSIIGVVTNNTDGVIDRLMIEFALYDADGSQIGTTGDSLSALQPHRAWKFRAPVYDVMETKRFTMTRLECR
jgi:hypothetical protein